MNKLMAILLICLTTIFAAGVSTAAETDRRGLLFERTVQCHWLIASSEDTQGEQSEPSSDNEEEPDCD